MNEEAKKKWGSALTLIQSLWSYIDNLRTVSRDDGMTVRQLMVESTVLFFLRGVDTRMYFMYRLYDRRLSWADKATYLPTNGSLGVAKMRSLHCPPRIARFFWDKLSFHYTFNTLNLPLARACAVYNGDTGYLEHVPALRNEAELDHWMRTTDVVELAYKPILGSNGKKILIFVGRAPDDAGTLITLTGKRYDAKKLVAFSGSETFLFEQRIRQHPVLSELLGETLCCVRVVTFIALDGTPRLLGSVFKLQAQALGVDHLRYGAVGSWVEPDTGRLHIARTFSSLKSTWRIPGTDRSFEGFHLPFWDEVKALALKAAAGLPFARSIGWDIAISDQGPVLIEGNHDWSLDLIQMPAPYGLMRGEFKAMCDALRERHLDEQKQTRPS